jgi:hypothetical protein
MQLLTSHDVVYLSPKQGTCPACGAALFAVVRTYFADTGEPVEQGMHVGCVNCDVEIGDPILSSVRHWVSSNYRIAI